MKVAIIEFSPTGGVLNKKAGSAKLAAAAIKKECSIPKAVEVYL